MVIPQVVLDTNIIVSGLRSKRGCAFQILSLVGTGKFDIHLSVPLVLEYQDVLSRDANQLHITPEDVDRLIAFHCAVATRHRIFFLWRPYLSDPKDDMILELAVKAKCDSVVTYNTKDFVGIERFGIQAVRPVDFLRTIGVLA
jgi:putative PIN family toxin of toxin-antitoxin system